MTAVTRLPKTTGERLRWLRSQRHETLDEVAVAVGTSRQHLIRLEKGLHEPRPLLLDKLAAHFDAADFLVIAPDRAMKEARLRIAKEFEKLADALADSLIDTLEQQVVATIERHLGERR